MKMNCIISIMARMTVILMLRSIDNVLWIYSFSPENGHIDLCMGGFEHFTVSCIICRYINTSALKFTKSSVRCCVLFSYIYYTILYLLYRRYLLYHYMFLINFITPCQPPITEERRLNFAPISVRTDAIILFIF